MEVFAKNTKYG